MLAVAKDSGGSNVGLERLLRETRTLYDAMIALPPNELRFRRELWAAIVRNQEQIAVRLMTNDQPH